MSSPQDMTAKQEDISHVIKTLIEEKKIGPKSGQGLQMDGDTAPFLHAIVYDLDAVDASLSTVNRAFPSNFHHRFAMKSCPLNFFVKKVIDQGIGLECASLFEVQHALKLGCSPGDIVFDSPCKTMHDIQFALEKGVMINADNFDELSLIAELMNSDKNSHEEKKCVDFGDLDAPSSSLIGLRINPLLGLGTNEILSVSTTTSKFGIPLTDINRDRILKAFQDYPWINALHCHVGSKGISVDMLSRGAKKLSDLADEIDATLGRKAVNVLNIGGGLASNFEDEKVWPTFEHYSENLQKVVPSLFTGERIIMTEFGRTLCAKTAWVCSSVEYVKNADTALPTGIIHAGSDLFPRECYVPDLFRNEIEIYTDEGDLSTEESKVQNVAGPLCFAGDLVARRRSMPRIKRGDYVVIRDTGSNTISLFSRHCSRPAPVVYGYSKETGDCFLTKTLKPRETVEAMLGFWG